MRHLLTTLMGAASLLATATPALADHVVVRPLTTACPANQVSATPFADVAADSPFELAISCLADYGTTRGRTTTAFDPAGTVSRQQMAQFLHRLGSGADVSWDTTDAGFTDLDDVSPEAREAINALANADVAQGRSRTAFDPNGAVTRAQMASFLARLAQAAGATGFEVQTNAFDDDEGLTHEENIDRIATAGVTTGRGSDRFFDPFSAVTRQQMAAFLARTLDVFIGQGLTASPFRADVAPAAVTLDQSGQLVQPGSGLTGTVSGDRIRSAGMAAPCARGPLPVSGGYSVPTDPQAVPGPCPVALAVTFDNGRTVTSEHRVVMPGYVDRPELVAIEPMETSQDSTTSQVRFVFDEPVQLMAVDDPAASFGLYGYLPSFNYSGSYRAQQVRPEGNAVIATFGTPNAPFGSEELRQISHGTAGVIGADGQASVSGEAVLEPGSTSGGSYAGPTPYADLLTVTPSRTSEEPYAYDFTFDKRLVHPGDYAYNDYANPGEYQFEVLLTDGISVPCNAPEFVPARQIAVVCIGADPDRIARGLVSYRHAEGDTGARGTEPRHVSLLRNQATVTPDLVAVEPGPRPDQVTVVFDEPVDLREQRFHVGDLGGTRFGIRAEAMPDDPARIILNGEGYNRGNSLDWVRLVTARGGAVTSRATGSANVLDQGWLQSKPPAVPAGSPQNLLRVVVDEQAVAHFVFNQFMALEEEYGNRTWSHSTYLRDGTQLTCTMGYEAADSPYPEIVTNACRDFHVVGDEGAKLRPATSDEVRALTLAVVNNYGNVNALLVEGQRR